MVDVMDAAAAAVDDATAVVDAACRHLAHASADGDRISVAKLDEHQVLAYDLAHAASAVEGCRVMLDYAAHGEYESMLARAFIADALVDLGSRLLARTGVWGVDGRTLDAARCRSSRRTARPRSSRRSPRTSSRRHRAVPPPRRVRPRARDLPPLRRRQDPTRRRARAPDNPDIPEEIVVGPRRDRRLRALGPRGVRRLRGRRRARLPRHGRRDRGALVGLARRRWLAHHATRDPHAGHRARRHRGAEATVAPADRVR